MAPTDVKSERSNLYAAWLAGVAAFFNVLATLLLVLFAARQERATYISSLSNKQLELVADYLRKANFAQKYAVHPNSINDHPRPAAPQIQDQIKMLTDAEEAGRVPAIIIPQRISGLVGNSIYVLEADRLIVQYLADNGEQSTKTTAELRQALSTSESLLKDVQNFTYTCAAHTFITYGVLLDETIRDNRDCEFNSSVGLVKIGVLRDVIPGMELRPANGPEYLEPVPR